MNDDHGKESERLTQAIASIRFLADFTFANPTYKKGRVDRELADLLVVVGNTLLVFQVKSHLARPQSEHDLKRASRKIDEAFRQFRCVLEAASDPELRTLRNSRGFEVPFDLTGFDSICLIAVIHYVRTEDSPRFHFRTTGYTDGTMPITFRAFEAEDFFFLAHQFDTVPDFAAFMTVLDVIEARTETGIDLGYGDLVAFARLYSDELITLMKTGAHPPHLREGVLGELLPRGEEFEYRESYVVDQILDDLHTAVGAESWLEKKFNAKLRFPLNSIESYWHSAVVLASAPRIRRQEIGLMLERKRKAAAKNGYAYGAIFSVDDADAVLIHSSSSSRTDRARELGGLAISFLAEHPEVECVIGLAAPTHHDGAEGCEILTLRRDWIENFNAVKARVETQRLFSAPRLRPG